MTRGVPHRQENRLVLCHSLLKSFYAPGVPIDLHNSKCKGIATHSSARQQQALPSFATACMFCLPGCADAAAGKETPLTLTYLCACAGVTQHERCWSLETVLDAATTKTKQSIRLEVLIGMTDTVDAQNKASQAGAGADVAAQRP